MLDGLERLLSRYDEGRISRRELLAGIAALFIIAPTASTSHAPTIGEAKQLNHATLFVPDVQRSKAFYQGLFGLPVLTPQDPGINLKAGSSFIGLYPAQGRPTAINHICIGIERFDADAILQMLTAQGVTAHIRNRGDTKELYFSDPDGINVQIQDVSYIGGVGPLGGKYPT